MSTFFKLPPQPGSNDPGFVISKTFEAVLLGMEAELKTNQKLTTRLDSLLSSTQTESDTYSSGPGFSR